MPSVLQRAVGLHVKCRHGSAIRHVDRLLVRAENHAVCPEVLAVACDHPLRVGVEQTSHREVHTAVAIGGEIVDDTTKAIERVAVGQLVS
jgi:hypothetical protein